MFLSFLVKQFISSLLVLERWPARVCRHIKEILFPYKVYDFFQKWFIKVYAFDPHSPLLPHSPGGNILYNHVNASFFFFYHELKHS